MFLRDSTELIIDSWFIPFDIIMSIFTIISVILCILFLLIILFDKTCHTIPMLLVANSYISLLIFAGTMFSFCIFTFINDLKQIQYEDSLCIFRAYLCYVSAGLLDQSFLIQSLYRYITVVHPNRLFWQSIKFQCSIICLSWIFNFTYPFIFMFTNEIIYNIDNQICQLPLKLSFTILYMSHCAYVIPLLITMFIYLKLIRYVHQMSKRVTPVNVLHHAKRQLKMVRRIVILIILLMTFGVPYMTFIFMSFITKPPKYHFRIAFIFVDISLTFVIIALFLFTDSLKMFIMKKFKRRTNVVVATVM